MNKKISRAFHRKRKHVIKQSKFLLRHPLVVPVTIFIALFVFGLLIFVSLGSSVRGASDARIVNVYADGQQHTVTTRAKSVGDLLERLELHIANEDIVEPHKDALILEDDMQVNVYRARPVAVVDNGRVKTLLTAQRAPRLVAIEAGIKLLPEDEVSFEHIDTSFLESSASEQLAIDRSVEIQMTIYGVVKKFRTTADTVDELLVDEGIVPSENELVQPSRKTIITDGMLVSVNRPGVKTFAKKKTIPFEVIFETDNELEAGQSKLKQKGREGQRAIIYEVTIDRSGKEVRKKIQDVILKKPVDEVHVRGTKIVSPGFNSSTTVSGDKASLMAAAGISASDFGFADFIISHESGWRPGALNVYTGAYGLCQALPGSKMATAGSDYMTNPVTQLKWCTGYAVGRYGGWGGAYGAWQAQGWW